MKRVARVRCPCAARKLVAGKAGSPKEVVNGRPPALPFPLHACPSVPTAESGVDFISEEGSLSLLPIQCLLTFWGLEPHLWVCHSPQISSSFRETGSQARSGPICWIQRGSSCMGNMDPGKKPQKGGLTTCWLVLLCSGRLYKRRRVCPRTAEFCHHHPSPPPARDHKRQGGSGGQIPPKCWTFQLPSQDHQTDLAWIIFWNFGGWNDASCDT